MNAPETSSAPFEGAANDEATARARALNDRLRTTFTGGAVFISDEINASGDLPRLITAIKEYQSWDTDLLKGLPGAIDHSSGQIELSKKQVVCWSINSLAPDGSPSSIDHGLDDRILTITLINR